MLNDENKWYSMIVERVFSLSASSFHSVSQKLRHLSCQLCQKVLQWWEFMWIPPRTKTPSFPWARKTIPGKMQPESQTDNKFQTIGLLIMSSNEGDICHWGCSKIFFLGRVEEIDTFSSSPDSSGGGLFPELKSNEGGHKRQREVNLFCNTKSQNIFRKSIDDSCFCSLAK